MSGFIDIFLESLLTERGYAKNTLEAYGRDLKDFKTFQKEVPLDQITPNHIRSYLKTLHSRALESKSIARRLSALRQFYRFLYEQKNMATNPTLDIDIPKIGKNLPKTLTTEEISSLIQGAYDGVISDKEPEQKRLICFLELLYASGLRVSELVTLPLSGVLSALRSNDTPLPLFITGKGNKERVVLLSESSIQALRSYIKIRGAFLQYQKDDNPFLFPSTGADSHLTRQRIGQLLKNLAIAVGLAPWKISPHIIRHAFASHMLHNGADLISLQALLGHSDISTTEIYTHLQRDSLEQAVLQHHPLSILSKSKKNSMT